MTVNPILAFSARRRMRSVRTALLLTLYSLAVLIFGLAVAFGAFLKPQISIYTMMNGQSGYAAMMAFQFFLLLLVTPAMTAGAISGERERQTLDLLLVTNTGSLRIVLGKLLESLGLMLLLIFATLPAMCLVLVTGSMTLAQVLVGLLFLGVTAFAMLSVGMLCSALLRRTVAATVAAYLAVFAIGLVTLLPLIGDVRSAGRMYDAVYSSYYSGPVAVIGASDAPSGMRMASFVFNPALGLMALIAAQTGLLRGTLSNYSYTMYEMYDYLDFAGMARLCMAFMASTGLALNLLAACFVRPRKARVRKGKKA
ncbi:MAG: ABC transporter permease subunit [Clostridia bacterium]|nr:ABC transporter permease subunit [Clostridia bacterium]